jgi:hypothetical protein
MSFKSFLKEQQDELVENAGNLSVLPRQWVKAIASRLGGRNSNIQLVKEVKNESGTKKVIKDLLEQSFDQYAQVADSGKNIGPTDIDKIYSAVLIKQGGVFVKLIAPINDLTARTKFTVLDEEGMEDGVDKTQQSSIGFGRRRRIKSKTYKETTLSFKDVADKLPVIDKDNPAEIYAVTSDIERIKTSIERISNKSAGNAREQETRRKAAIKYIQKELGDVYKSKIDELNSINNEVLNVINDSMDNVNAGKYIDIDTKGIKNKFNRAVESLSELNNINRYIEKYAETGTVEAVSWDGKAKPTFYASILFNKIKSMKSME